MREEIQNLQQVFCADFVLDHFQDVSVPLELEVRVVEDLQRQWWRRRVELEHRRVQVGENILNEAHGLIYADSRRSSSSSCGSSSGSSRRRIWVCCFPFTLLLRGRVILLPPLELLLLLRRQLPWAVDLLYVLKGNGLHKELAVFHHF